MAGRTQQTFRSRITDRGSADPFAAILPEIAEPKLYIQYAEEEDYSIPSRPVSESCDGSENRAASTEPNQR
jgi:hypothetical protein